MPKVPQKFCGTFSVIDIMLSGGNMKKIKTKLKLSVHPLNILTAWILAVTLEFLRIPKELRSLDNLSAISMMSGIRIFLYGTVFFVILNIISSCLHFKKTERCLLVCATVSYIVFSVISSFTWPFLGVCILLIIILGVYFQLGWDKSTSASPTIQKERKIWCILTVVASIMFFCLDSAWTVARVRSFCAPSFDFGIFSQMFFNMKTSGIPVTTLERDGLLSHFAVHMSPIYYFMLPIYCLIPRPETLQVLQAAVMSSAVIPLWKLGKYHGLHSGLRTAICILLLLFPAYIGGSGYDIHENCFLTPLLLWLLYEADRKNIPFIFLFSSLTFLVKEDAPIYVAIIALYLFVRALCHKDRTRAHTGLALFVYSLVYFLLVTSYLSAKGEGVMTYRYKNFIYDGSSSLITVIKAILICPIKAIFECVDVEKLKYIGLTMLPLVGIPIFTRRYERFILLIPYLLFNLMSDYRYQHDIMFQYNFGSIACLIYLVLVNIADMKKFWKQIVLLGIALGVSMGCFYKNIYPVAKRYISTCVENQEYYESQRSILDTIPEKSSVAATTFYTAYLSNRPELYDIRYGSTEHILNCEYVVINVNESSTFKRFSVDETNGEKDFVELLLRNGYVLEKTLDGVIEVYRKSGFE